MLLDLFIWDRGHPNIGRHPRRQQRDGFVRKSRLGKLGFGLLSWLIIQVIFLKKPDQSFLQQQNVCRIEGNYHNGPDPRIADVGAFFRGLGSNRLKLGNSGPAAAH
jgi:hypothetical protein